jgi:adenosylcobyric acid synthase
MKSISGSPMAPIAGGPSPISRGGPRGDLGGWAHHGQLSARAFRAGWLSLDLYRQPWRAAVRVGLWRPVEATLDALAGHIEAHADVAGLLALAQ